MRTRRTSHTAPTHRVFATRPPLAGGLRAGSADGFTLIEMLVAMAAFLLVTVAVMAPLALSAQEQQSTANYADAQQTAQVGLDGMVAQVRQAWSILSTSPNAVEMDVNLGGVGYQVLYECDIPQSGTTYRECIRVQSAVGAALPPLSSGTVVVANLLNGTTADPVFSFAPDPIAPYYMTATVEVPAADGRSATGLNLAHAIAFSDGALMRNENVGD